MPLEFVSGNGNLETARVLLQALLRTMSQTALKCTAHGGNRMAVLEVGRADPHALDDACAGGHCDMVWAACGSGR